MNSKKLAFWNIWSSYATYYFGKVNLSIVIPVLLLMFSDLNMYSIGAVSSAFFFAYAIGQFLHGQISERFNPFVYISIGLIGSAIMNLILGFWGGIFWILLMGEFLDGICQSMGWSSCVRANSLIQDSSNRERSSVFLGTSYQIGNSIAWLISALVVSWWGWQAGFFVASSFLFTRGITLLMTMPKIDPVLLKPNKIKLQLKETLNWAILLGGLSLCLINMIRFGMISWIPLYLFEQGSMTIESIGKVGIKVCLLPLAGVIGTLLYNKIKIQKELLTIIYLIGLAISFIVLPFTSGALSLIVLLIGSFFMYGPHVFFVTTFPSRFLDKKIVAAATGFIDGMGYVGTILIGLIVPFLVTTTVLGWTSVFIFWAILSVIVAIVSGILYCKKN